MDWFLVLPFISLRKTVLKGMTIVTLEMFQWDNAKKYHKTWKTRIRTRSVGLLYNWKCQEGSSDPNTRIRTRSLGLLYNWMMAYKVPKNCSVVLIVRCVWWLVWNFFALKSVEWRLYLLFFHCDIKHWLISDQLIISLVFWDVFMAGNTDQIYHSLVAEGR